MFYITESKDYELIYEILSNEKLSRLSGWDKKLDKSYTYYVIEQLGVEEDVVVGMLQTKAMTSEVLKAHIHILPEFWGKGLALEASLSAFRHITEVTKFNKLFTNVPVTCIHVLTYLKKIGANICGMIKEGCMYDGKLTDLILFDYNLRTK